MCVAACSPAFAASAIPRMNCFAVRSPSLARMITREAASSFRRSLSGRKGTACARKCAPSPVAALTASNAGRAIVVAT